LEFGMSQWLSEIASSQGTQLAAGVAAQAAAQQGANNERVENQLRVLDCTLVALVALVVALPYALLRPFCRLQRAQRMGRRGVVFQRLHLVLPATAWGRLLAAFGVANWPVLFNIWRADMAWVGPQALPPPVPGPLTGTDAPRFWVRPGLTSLWDLRQRTALDFGTEDEATLEYLAQRGPGHDLGLLARSLFVRIFAAKREAAAGRVRICDVEFDNVNMEEALARLEGMLDASGAHQVSFVNPACVNIAAGHRGYRRSLARAGFVLPDGIGTKIAGDLLGTPLKQNVNGTDLFPLLFERLNRRQTKVFLLGGQRGVPEAVAQYIGQRWPQVQICGVRDGFFTTAQEGDVAAQVKASGAEFLMVARGVPMQDVFIDRYLHHFGTRVAMGVGGLFDFVSGRIDRAPRWLRDIGMEWTYRLLQEPLRMWRRYLIGNLTFLARVLMQRLRLRHPADDSLPLVATLAPAAGAGQGTTTAVLLATATAHADIPVGRGFPAALLPMGHETFIERAISQLAQAGVQTIHVVASDRPELLRRVLADGRRWGVTLVWHTAKDERQALQVLPLVASGPYARIIVAQAESWISAQAVVQLTQRNQLVERLHPEQGPQWAGWASTDAVALQGQGEPTSLEQLLRSLAPDSCVLTRQEWACASSAKALLDAQTWLSDGPKSTDAPKSWLRMPWGAMSPSAHVDSNAIMTGPVTVGPGCMIEAGAVVGPYVVMTKDVIISSNSTVRNSVLLAKTYVGAGLEIGDAVVNGGSVQHVGLGVRTDMPGSEGRMLATGDRAIASVSLVGRVAAAVALLVFSPLAMVVALQRKLRRQPPLWATEQMVGPRPAPDLPPSLRPLRLACNRTSRLTAALAQVGPLMDVALGRRCWVGARPRRASEWYALHPEWQAQLEHAPVGAFNSPTWSDDPAGIVEASAAADLFLLAQPAGLPRLRVVLDSVRWLWSERAAPQFHLSTITVHSNLA
jgi:N-acetylglucosaminyldiphosphoundecaprenol N-acetyl-beta-D-mannosaminyltransferase